MSHKLINLLPAERVQAFQRDYFLRLGTVGMMLLILLTIIHGVLLFPSYFALSQKRDAKVLELRLLDAGIAGSKEEEIRTRLDALKENATYLARLDQTSSVSAAMRAVLQTPRSGVLLTSFTFTPASSVGGDGKMSVSGVASTREALRSYNRALSALPFISRVDLPIGAYAEETDITFTVTLVGAFTL